MGREMPAPKQALSVPDAVALIVGMVVGAGIFKTPALVAANSGSEGGAVFISMLVAVAAMSTANAVVITGAGAMVGACVLLAGVPLLFIARRRGNK